MFKPAENGVWVALKKVEWQWGETVYNVGSAQAPVWQEDAQLKSIFNPNAYYEVKSAVGDWPTWKARTSDIADGPGGGWVKVN